MTGRKISHREAAALQEGQTHSEKIGSRGAGVLLLVGRQHGVAAYYRYTDPDKKRLWIDLGQLEREISLADARERCAELNSFRREHPFLREWLNEQAINEQRDRERVAHEALMATRVATLGDLLTDYLNQLRTLGRASIDKIEHMIARTVNDAVPHLVDLPARDITPSHILEILKPITSRGSKVQRNRVRSALHAAFQFGLRCEYDETRESGRVFGLQTNPVAAIPALQGVERVGERALTDIELRHFYKHISDVPNVGIVMATCLRFLIATGGQRPRQVLNVPRRDYDLSAKTIKIIDRKGRGSHPRVHLVPLSVRATKLLETIDSITGGFSWPFTTYGDAPLHTDSLKKSIRYFLASEFGKIDGVQIPPFSTRDLRRSCKQLMVRASIRRDLRNLLQNHGQTGVDVRSYANEPTAHLPEKWEALRAFDAALQRVLEPNIGVGNVVIGKFRK